jgi:adenosylcobinamide-phosphate synthase
VVAVDQYDKINFRMIISLGLAAGLDFIIGDPWSWLHPVQVMGWGISAYSKFVLKRVQNPWLQTIAGLLLTLLLLSISGGVTWAMVSIAALVHPWAGIATESILLASCFAGKSLRDAAEDVLTPLQDHNLSEARLRLSRYVGRDTAQLSEPEILRAVLETVAENGVDGVMAPLFWAIVGALTPIGPVPFAMAYKAVSTLDSMVGYIAPPYTHLGWCSAKLDDVLTYLPCRLMVITLGIVSRHPIALWQQCDRDGRQDPSPNSGWSECAYAVALGVQLGGLNTYRGVAKSKPILGIASKPITPSVVRSALDLNRRCFLSWLLIAIGLMMLGSV